MDSLEIKTDQQNSSSSSVPEVDASDYIVDGAASDKSVITKVKKFKAFKEDNVIYGVYNNSQLGISTRINDFLIDHSKVGLKEKSYFFHMLAVMVDAGIPIVGAVKSLAVRSDNPRFRRILNTVAYYCEQGSPLADSLSRFEDVFTDSEIGVIRSGEATGRLDLMLFKLSEQLDKKHELYLKLWGAAIYPIAVLIVLLIVSVAMLVWVFPTLLNLLKEGGISDAVLPAPTRALIFIQNILVGYWWAVLIFVFAIYGAFTFYKSSDYGADKWDYRKLTIPIFGILSRKVFVLNYVSVLGLLIDSGLPVIRALKITGESISNRIYKAKIQEVINEVKAGAKISDSMADSEFLFPPEVTQMMRVGENSASLGNISKKIADQYQREIDNSLKKMSSVFEPVMILFVGVFVALLALAIMAPIFNISGSISV